jgi:hypothetical protein
MKSHDGSVLIFEGAESKASKLTAAVQGATGGLEWLTVPDSRKRWSPRITLFPGSRDSYPK